MTIDELIIQSETEIKALINIINTKKTEAKLFIKNENYKFAALSLMNIMTYQERLEILTYQLRSLKAIKENQ